MTAPGRTAEQELIAAIDASWGETDMESAIAEYRRAAEAPLRERMRATEEILQDLINALMPMGVCDLCRNKGERHEEECDLGLAIAELAILHGVKEPPRG